MGSDGVELKTDFICPHGKTVDEDCADCELVWEQSGLQELVDALIDEGIELPDESEE